MENEDLYPNDSTYFMPREPKEQIIGRKKEKAHTLEDLKVLATVIDHLERRIEFYGSVDAMPEEVKDDPTKFMNLHNANQLTRDNLRSEKEYLDGLLDNVGQLGM